MQFRRHRHRKNRFIVNKFDKVDKRYCYPGPLGNFKPHTAKRLDLLCESRHGAHCTRQDFMQARAIACMEASASDSGYIPKIGDTLRHAFHGGFTVLRQERGQALALRNEHAGLVALQRICALLSSSDCLRLEYMATNGAKLSALLTHARSLDACRATAAGTMVSMEEWAKATTPLRANTAAMKDKARARRLVLAAARKLASVTMASLPQPMPESMPVIVY